jgi:crotonobetainyl-CoA:carnitine CoA-transferase CaiB-like acyl-CoA transferase
VDGGIAVATELGLAPLVIAGEGEAGVPTIRNPVTFSATPPSYPLPPPAFDEHGKQIRAWLAATPPDRTEDP